MPQHSHKIRVVEKGSAGYGLAAYNDAEGWDSNYCSTEGGSQPHNNMPPYLVTKLWKRTA